MHEAATENATTATKVGVTIAVIALLLIAFNSARFFRAEPQGDWDKPLRAADDAYWAAYNRADAVAMNAMLADDVEFYHDRGGSLVGKAALSGANDVMKTSKDRLRRAAVDGTVHFYPMRKGEQLYGAMVTGEHQFFATSPGKPESFAGRARFTQLMVLDGAQWKVSRIFSYDHLDAK